MYNELITFSAIKRFSAENKLKVHNIASISQCKKWYKWFNTGETPYPCVCPVRDVHCVELELYYELQSIVEIYEQDAYFKQAIEDFKSIDMQDNIALLSWVKKNEAVGSKLFFNSTIVILRNSEKNDKLIIQLNTDEFSTVIQFQEIFQTVYYSEEFKNNINL